jgi:hypothetical protein
MRGKKKGKEKGGADRWGRAVSEKEAGRGRERGEQAVVGKKEKSRATCGRGKGGPRGGLGHWVGLLLYFPFLFLFQSNSIYLNSKSNLNSNSYALTQRKLMHQHKCTNMLNLKINFNSLWNLFNLYAS